MQMCLSLALAFGRPDVGAFIHEMRASDFVLWGAYFDLMGIDPLNVERRHAEIRAMTANVWRKAEDQISPLSLMPRWVQDAAEEEHAADKARIRWQGLKLMAAKHNARQKGSKH